LQNQFCRSKHVKYEQCGDGDDEAAGNTCHSDRAAFTTLFGNTTPRVKPIPNDPSTYTGDGTFPNSWTHLLKAALKEF
jgi:hypothetical protein